MSFGSKEWLLATPSGAVSIVAEKAEEAFAEAMRRSLAAGFECAPRDVYAMRSDDAAAINALAGRVTTTPPSILDLTYDLLARAIWCAPEAAAGIVEEERRGFDADPTITKLHTVLDCAASCGEEALTAKTPEGRRHSLLRVLGWATIALALHDAEVASTQAAQAEGAS